MKQISSKQRVWIARILIGSVFLINVQCALLFIWAPGDYSYSFELSGAPGAAAVRAIGVLFLMWNVPYAFALFNPVKYRNSLVEAMIMQAIGLVGESLILSMLPAQYAIARLSITRFIIFDGAGLLALLLAAWISLNNSAKAGSPAGGR